MRQAICYMPAHSHQRTNHRRDTYSRICLAHRSVNVTQRAYSCLAPCNKPGRCRADLLVSLLRISFLYLDWAASVRGSVSETPASSGRAAGQTVPKECPAKGSDAGAVSNASIKSRDAQDPVPILVTGRYLPLAVGLTPQDARSSRRSPDARRQSRNPRLVSSNVRPSGASRYLLPVAAPRSRKPSATSSRSSSASQTSPSRTGPEGCPGARAAAWAAATAGPVTV